MDRPVVVRLVALAVTALVMVLTWPLNRETTTVELPDGEAAESADEDGGTVSGPEAEPEADDGDPGLDDADGSADPENGASSTGQPISDGSAQAFRNESGTYFSTLGAPEEALEWMRSSQILFNNPLPDDTPTVRIQM